MAHREGAGDLGRFWRSSGGLLSLARREGAGPQRGDYPPLTRGEGEVSENYRLKSEMAKAGPPFSSDKRALTGCCARGRRLIWASHGYSS